MNPSNRKEFVDQMMIHLRNYERSFVVEWMRSVGAPRFGDPSWDWSSEGAKALAAEFKTEASTW